MTKPLPPDVPRKKPGRKPLPPEQRKLWTLPELRERCKVTLTECWEWRFAGKATEHVRRYKCLVHGGERLSARQVAYLLVFGSLPAPGLNLSPAKCLNPRCISPFHCRPVTESQKCLIGSRRGTFATPERARNIARGKQLHNSKLPGGMEAAREIRAITGSAREHAPRFGISVSMFNAIRRGAAWKEEEPLEHGGTPAPLRGARVAAPRRAEGQGLAGVAAAGHRQAARPDGGGKAQA